MMVKPVSYQTYPVVPNNEMIHQTVFALLAAFSISGAAVLPEQVYDAPIEQYPFQISLKRWTYQTCSASIISDRWVLTAATCLRGASLSDITLHAGSSKLYLENEDKYSVIQAIPHKKFNPKSMEYDIALLKVDRPFQFSEAVKKIELPETDDKVTVGSLGEVSGWSLTENHRYSDSLKATKLPVIQSSVCEKFYQNTLTNRMICAGFTTGDRKSCQGDIGSPFVYNEMLYGVLAYSQRCAQLNQPGIYADVVAFRNWIKEKSQV